VRILVLVTRFPHPGTKGDQSRAWSWINHLAARHDVTVVTSGVPESSDWREALAAVATVVEAPSGPAVRAGSALRASLAGQPLQVGWMMPVRAWRSARRLAETHDVALAMTARSVRGPLACPLVLDHVDALSLNMARRARGPEPLPIRAFAALEARLLRRHERRLARYAVAQIVTAREDAEALPGAGSVSVIPVGLDAGPFEEPPGHERDIDLVLSGNMRYPPNRVAASLLADEILPRLRAHRPVRAMVVGRAADTLRLPGVEIASDVPDVAGLLRRSRVAIAPLSGGTGSPYKVLEAAAAGAALVTVPWAAERFQIAAEVAEDPDGYARAVQRLLDDEPYRLGLVTRAQSAVEAHLTSRLAARVEAILTTAASSGTGPASPR
jgi:glycosyltransferase involved in cell wall biosynthesis